MLINAHTHSLSSSGTMPGVFTLLNLYPGEAMPANAGSNVAFSVGLHPWHVDTGWREKAAMVRELASDERVWAIGECGLDKLRGDIALQRQAFEAQLDIARELRKPVVVHCVKAFDELLAMLTAAHFPNHNTTHLLTTTFIPSSNKTVSHPTVSHQPRVLLHGFRGKWQQAKQLAAKGVLLSFGCQYNIEALRFVHGNGIPFLLETDDSRVNIAQVYEQAARHLGESIAYLSSLCENNWRELFA